MKKDVSQYLPCEKFIVKKLLSHGSYGIVYLAYSHIQHQTVAVKVEKIPRGFNQNSSNLQREIINLKALNGIQGIPKVLDFDCETSQFSYFSMQMFGKDFSQLLKKCNNMFSHKTVLMIASQIITILKQIHEKGYIHRDIKPENLVLGSGQNRNKVYIIDFGTAKSFIDKTTKNHISFQGNYLTHINQNTTSKNISIQNISPLFDINLNTKSIFIKVGNISIRDVSSEFQIVNQFQHYISFSGKKQEQSRLEEFINKVYDLCQLN